MGGTSKRPASSRAVCAGAEALADAGDMSIMGWHEAARIALDAALPILERDIRRQAASEVLALDARNREQAERTHNRGPYYDMRTSLRRLARGEPLPVPGTSDESKD